MRTSSDNNSNSQPESGRPVPGSPTFACDFKSHLRNILLANPFFARICADAWQSARPNSLTTKLLQLNYQKLLNRNPMSNTRTCTHIKVTGVRCGSPALRGERYCYFHHRMLCDSRISHVALLENEEAIQVSIMEVVNSLLRGTIDVKRGELVLRALNTAVRNSRRVRFDNRSDMIRELPADPVVQPRPRQYPKEELAAIKKEMLAEYKKSKQTDVAAEAFVRPAPAQPVREIDPTQRKPPAGVKEVPAPQERKNKAHGVSRGKAG
jgi:hypothetical protein